MKNPLFVCLGCLLLAGHSLAETREFTNKHGKKLSAELILVENDEALLKLANSSRVKIPLASLSEADQEFVKSWWEKNKNNVTEMDVRLSIEKKSKRISSPDSGDAKGKGGDKNKVTKDEVEYIGLLKSYTRRDISDITANYTVYKKISTRGGEGSSHTTQEIPGKATIASLPANRSATFETTGVVCEDSVQKGSNKKGDKKAPSSSRRETVVGVVITLSANGKEFLQQSYPENLIDKLKEEEERNAGK